MAGADCICGESAKADGTSGSDNCGAGVTGVADSDVDVVIGADGKLGEDASASENCCADVCAVTDDFISCSSCIDWYTIPYNYKVKKEKEGL